MSANTNADLVRAVAIAAQALLEVFEAAGDRPEASAVVRAQEQLESAWSEYVERRGLFFEL